jgi:Circularly permutated YpsA SLOG family
MSKIYLRQIISGGQTGADMAGLLAARILGLATGGFAPLHYKTENGPNWELREFGLIEGTSEKYQPRTRENVKKSDGTVIFSKIPLCHGSRLTHTCTVKFYKPHLLIEPRTKDWELSNASQRAEFLHWLEKNKIVILNVAGNTESHNPGIGKLVEDFLVTALKGVDRG